MVSYTAIFQTKDAAKAFRKLMLKLAETSRVFSRPAGYIVNTYASDDEIIVRALQHSCDSGARAYDNATGRSVQGY